uniref:Phospholipase A2-like central domain-containing protein n=1 Tax=Leptobrachium leishanense TaxID=445787 RepID=A0A8C5WC20_9ANUR
KIFAMPGISSGQKYLSLFRGLDICCREHDHCTPQIQSFEFLYGFRNYRLHTVSHCDCDQRFRMCLQALNDTMSTLVGTIYFNFFEPPCFTLNDEEQCTEVNNLVPLSNLLSMPSWPIQA